MKNPGNGGHGAIRSDFPGGWAGDKINGFTGWGLTEKEQEAREFVRKLFNWRKDASVIHKGKTLHFAPENNGVYVFFRYNDTDTIMVILNKNENDVPLPIERYQEILGTTLSGKDILSNDGFENIRKLIVPAKSAMIIEVHKKH